MSARVDQLGKLNAKIAKLAEQAEEIKAMLKAENEATGQSEFSGALFKAVVSHSTSERLDQKKVRQFLSPQQLVAARVVSESVRVSVYDR